jgi:hypothetical protein
MVFETREAYPYYRRSASCTLWEILGKKLKGRAWRLVHGQIAALSFDTIACIVGSCMETGVLTCRLSR